MTDNNTTAPSPAGNNFSPAYRNFVLALLTLGYVFNFVDRQVMSILIEPIKAEFGATDTQMLLATADLYAVTPAELTEHQLIRRSIDPAEIAAAIAFCASSAGGVLNGSVLHADGGFTP